MFSGGGGCYKTSAVQGQDQSAPAPVVPELTKVNPLPGPKIQPAAADGYVQAGPEQG